ncbi:DUF6596 domain-containing protein [Mesorhizobium sp.]|nr:DUF6596 domain-containing protein [Mesorhizobium sp.]
MLLITHARRNARIDTDGISIPLNQQDRSLWKMDELNWDWH